MTLSYMHRMADFFRIIALIEVMPLGFRVLRFTVCTDYHTSGKVCPHAKFTGKEHFAFGPNRTF